MNCSRCGTKMSKKDQYCSKCGKDNDFYVKFNKEKTNAQEEVSLNLDNYHNLKNRNQQQHYSGPADNGGFWWGLFGFLIPIVGIVLVVIWNSDKPRNAKSVFIGSVLAIFLYIFLAIIL